MSYAEVWRFRRKNGKAQFANEAMNANGFYIHVWMVLGEKYDMPYIPGQERPSVWNLFGGERMSVEDQIVMGSTFDRFIVRQENLPRLIVALEKFQNERPHATITELVEILKHEARNPDTEAVGFNHSMNDGYWEPGPNRRRYNIRLDNNHKELFDTLRSKGIQI